MGENKKNQKGVIRIEQVSWRQPLCGDLSSAAAGSGRGGRHSKFQRSTVKTQTVRILQHISLSILYPLYTGDNIIFKQNKDLNPILYIWYMVFLLPSQCDDRIEINFLLYLTNVSLASLELVHAPTDKLFDYSWDGLQGRCLWWWV